MMAFPRANVAGFSISCTDTAGVADVLAQGSPSSTSARVYVLVNAHSAKLRRESLGYATLVRDAGNTVCLADGASVTYAARLLGHRAVGRCPGPDLLEASCARLAVNGMSTFLLGGNDGVAESLAESLSERYPGLQIAGTATPPFGEWSAEENERLVAAVKASGAQVLWMGVSAPKQEIWAYEHLEELDIPIACVGAAFDFNTGRKARAPMWMRRAGLEWVHRLFTEPRRMWKRYLIGNSLFLWDVVRYGRQQATSRTDEGV